MQSENTHTHSPKWPCKQGCPVHPDTEFGDALVSIMESLSPSDYESAKYDPGREFDSQPQTDTGERGKQEISGIRMRDLRDCFVVGCFEASGLSPSDYPDSLYKLPWNEMDPLAVFQNMSCEVERRMGIFPNIPPLEDVPN